jgi:predicted phage tail protein
MGAWPGTFDFWGNLGTSTGTLRGLNSDGSLTGFANVSLQSLGMTQEMALNLAQKKEKEIHMRWDAIEEDIKIINAAIAAGFFIAGLIAAAVGAAMVVTGVIVLVGVVLAIAGLIAEWFVPKDTPLDLAIKANFPSAASAQGG